MAEGPTKSPTMEKQETDWTDPSKTRRKILPSEASSDLEDDLSHMWKKVRSTLKAEKELTKMHLDDMKEFIKEQLNQSRSSTREEHPSPKQQTRFEDDEDADSGEEMGPTASTSRAHQARPTRRRTFASRIANKDFSDMLETKKVTNLSMLPHNEFVVASLKQDITRDDDHLKTLLLNIDLHERAMSPEEAEDNPTLTELKQSYMDKEVELERKKAQIRKAQNIASS